MNLLVLLTEAIGTFDFSPAHVAGRQQRGLDIPADYTTILQEVLAWPRISAPRALRATRQLGDLDVEETLLAWVETERWHRALQTARDRCR